MCYLQDCDRDLKKVKSWFQERVLHCPTWEEIATENHIVKTWWYRADQLVYADNGILYLRWKGASSRPEDPPSLKVVAVPAMYDAIQGQVHEAETPNGLAFGTGECLREARRSKFFWPGMSQDGFRPGVED